MISKRLLSVASFVDKDDNLIDVGCDHGYLGIYLKKNNLVNDLLLTDVNANALNNAINNINKSDLDIKYMLTDGLSNIDLNNYNAISISGMGTHTIINILSVLKNRRVDKLIIQSNNDLDLLRREVIKLGYYLDDEITLREKDIFYVTMCFKVGNKDISDEEILFGINKKDKEDYYLYLLNLYNDILNKTNNKEDITNKINILNKLLKESR